MLQIQAQRFLGAGVAYQVADKRSSLKWQVRTTINIKMPSFTSHQICTDMLKQIQKKICIVDSKRGKIIYCLKAMFQPSVYICLTGEELIIKRALKYFSAVFFDSDQLNF